MYYYGKFFEWNKEISTIDFLKVDAEGLHYEVLKGFGKYLEKVQIIQTEAKNLLEYRGKHYLFNDIARLLMDYGFVILGEKALKNRKSKLCRVIAFKAVDILVNLIRKISESTHYCEIEDAFDRGYIRDYVYRCRKYIRRARNVLEFDGPITYGRGFNENLKLAAWSGHKDKWTTSDYYFDLMDASTLPTERFDCIIATEILYCLTDVHLALENLKELLTEEGILILTIHGPVMNRGENIAFYSMHGAEVLCKEHFRRVFNIREYGDLNHAIYGLMGMGRIKEREDLKAKDNITITTGICCQK